MDLYYNGEKITTLNIQPQNTIGYLKKVIGDWLEPQGITNYTIHVDLNNNSQLSQVVFSDNKYNGMDLTSVKDYLKGSKIHITQNTPNYDTMPKEIMFKLAMGMDVKDILSLCNTSKNFNRHICENKEIWYALLLRDYEKNRYEVIGDPKQQYLARMSMVWSIIYVGDHGYDSDVSSVHRSLKSVRELFRGYMIDAFYYDTDEDDLTKKENEKLDTLVNEFIDNELHETRDGSYYVLSYSRIYR